MDEADSKPTPAPRWASLTEDEQQKIGDTKDPAKARKLILNQLVRGEGKGRHHYRYKRVDDLEGRWCEDGLPKDYYWSEALELDPLSGSAQINWLNATAIWPERFGPRYRPALEIYAIEVVIWDGPLWVAEPAPTDEPILLEPEPLEPKLELEPEPEPELEPVPADGTLNDSSDEAISHDNEPEAEGDTASTKDDPTDKAGRLHLILTGLSKSLTADMTPAQVAKLARQKYRERWPEREGDPKSKFPSRTTVRRVFTEFMKELKK